MKKAQKLYNFLSEHGRTDILVEVDGNITPEHGVRLQHCGTQLFVGGTSCIFKGNVEHYGKNIRRFREALKN